MSKAFDFLKKQRYEYYNGSTSIIDNEVDELVEDVCDRLNTQDFKKNELLKVKQRLESKIAELEHRLANCIEPKFKVCDGCYIKVGQTIQKSKVLMLHIDKGGIVYELTMDDFPSKYTTCRNDDCVFATEEEARKKLEELKNG